MHTQLIATMVTMALSAQEMVTYLQGLFGPLFLGIVGIVAIFFLFISEIISVSVGHCAFCGYCSEFQCVWPCLQARHWRSERARSSVIQSSDEGERQ